MLSTTSDGTLAVSLLNRVDGVGSWVASVHKILAWVTWVEILVWVAWVHKNLAWVAWVEILAWVEWVGVGQKSSTGKCLAI